MKMMMDACEQLILERMRMTKLEYNRLHDVLCTGDGSKIRLPWERRDPPVRPKVYFESKEAVYACIKECYVRLKILPVCLEKSRVLRKVEPYLPEEVLYRIVTHDIKATDTNLINN